MTRTQRLVLPWLALLFVLSISPLTLHAEDLQATGVSTATISGNNESAAYKKALGSAKKDAVIELAVKVVGKDARTDPTVKQAAETIAQQMEEYFEDEESDSEEDKITVRITAVIDAQRFRELIREQGIEGAQTAAANVKIAIMVDEYVTVPRDFGQPESIKVFFQNKKKSAFSDQSVKASSSVAARDSKANYNQNIDARSAQATSVRANESFDASSAARVSGQGGSIAAADAVSARRSGSLDSASASSLKANTSASAQSSAFAKSANIDKKDVRAASSDETTYSNEIKFQTPSKDPDTQRRVETSLVKLFRAESIEIANTAVFRSGYFKEKQQSLRNMMSGPGLSKFVTAIATDKGLDADYLMFGTATIVEIGPDERRPGYMTCGGYLDVQALHVRTSRVLTAGDASELGYGQNIDQCANNVAERLAQEAGPEVAKILLNYFKEAEMFGTQYDVIVVGSKLNLLVSTSLEDIFEELKIKKAQKKNDTPQLIDYAVRYKGDRALDTQIAVKLMKALGLTQEPVRKVDGSSITICLDNCKALLK
jgi:hypothetical protein